MENSTSSGNELWNHPVVFRLRILFYIVTPEESSFKTISQVPNYYELVTTFVSVAIVAESLFLWMRGDSARIPSWTNSLFYLPMALFIPPSVFLVHVQLNIIYQAWLHTETIPKLNVLEKVLMTPRHHRVHHGRNCYCIDCNYGGVLIIWDKMFGTFVEERQSEVISYGLVNPMNSWDLIHIQLRHLKHIGMMVWNRSGFESKMLTLVYGPGWSPGKPRLGLVKDIPDIKGLQQKFTKSCLLWKKFYTAIHLGMTLVALKLFDGENPHLSFESSILITTLLAWSLINIGYTMEHKCYAPYIEVLRCTVILWIDCYLCGLLQCSSYLPIIRAVYGISASVWIYQSAAQIQAI